MCFVPDDPLLNVFNVSVCKTLFCHRLAINCELEQNSDSFILNCSPFYDKLKRFCWGESFKAKWDTLRASFHL